ncbi:hypothetical protein VNO77_00912 [Canavalia gladiata]|uniref:Uncharacterized protein n=1 Tax=Canavalia gladiata TaxID=3824 RepID=A0AAN9R5S9_CANGL
MSGGVLGATHKVTLTSTTKRKNLPGRTHEASKVSDMLKRKGKSNKVGVDPDVVLFNIFMNCIMLEGKA